jgi:hypothetical protein
MRPPGGPKRLGLALAIFLLLSAPLSTSAQQTVLPDHLFVSSRDKAAITNQLQLAAGLGKKTLMGLHAMSTDDAVPLDSNLLRNAGDTYKLIRAARHGLAMARERTKYPDPILDLSFKRVGAAWDLSRTPVDMSASASVSREEYQRRSIEDLSRALKLVDQALLLLL